MSKKLNLQPNVIALFKPIVDAMTQIQQQQKLYPQVGPHNEPEAVKAMKRRCVHMVWIDKRIPDPNNINYNYQNTSETMTIAAKRKKNGELVCQACGRTLNTTYDETAVNTIMAAIQVIDGLVLMGAANNLDAEALRALISVKELLPGVAMLQAELNDYIRRDTQNAQAETNIVEIYETPERFGSITGYHT